MLVDSKPDVMSKNRRAQELLPGFHGTFQDTTFFFHSKVSRQNQLTI